LRDEAGKTTFFQILTKKERTRHGMVCDGCALFLLKFEKIEGVKGESARESAKRPKGSDGKRKDFRRKP
jgi:hypothetical protein